MPHGRTRTPSGVRPSWARVSRLRVALLFLALFGVFHLSGWREDTSILSGTFRDHNACLAAARGVLYALSYFAAVVVSPILILAAGLDLFLSQILIRFKRRRQGTPEAE